MAPEIAPPPPASDDGAGLGVPAGFQSPNGTPIYSEADVARPIAWSPTQRADIQARLVAAGLLDPDDFQPGVWNSNSANAYRALLTNANIQGKTATTLLDEAAVDPQILGKGKTSQQAAPVVAGGNVGGGDVFRINQSDPATVRAVAEKAARSVLGRRLTKDELAAFVNEFTAAEQAEQAKVNSQLAGADRAKFDATNASNTQTANARASGGVVSPVPGASISDTMGAPRSGGRKHMGTDIFGDKGSPAVAPIGGQVVKAGNGGGKGGLRVWIKGDDGRFHYLAHLDRVDVKEGQRIEQGVQIGTVGNTGNAKNTPPHIHYSINSSPNSEDAVGNPAHEIGTPSTSGVIQIPNTYLPTTTVTTTDVDPTARAEEHIRAENPVEATTHDLAVDTYGSFLNIIGAK